MRCPSCGARNATDATWCTQCFAPVGPSPGEAGAATPSDRRAYPDVAPGGPVADAAGPHDAGGPGRDVRDRAGTVEWRCVACDGWNDLTLTRCGTCGSARTGFGLDDRPARSTRPPPDRVLLAAAVAPGLGHLLAGRLASGVARMLLALLWLAGGVTISFGGATGATRLPGVVLLLGAVTLWLGSAVDARELAAGGRREILGNRPLLWLVVAVTGLVTVSLLVASAAR